MIVHAFAGTGKTHTLRAYAAARPRETFLYIVFNKGNQSEASKSFPPNVQSRTSHALAMAGGMHIYSHKLGNPTAMSVARAYRRDPYDAHCAINLVKAYCSSGAQRLEDTPCPATAERERLEAKLAILTDPERIRRAVESGALRDAGDIRQKQHILERAVSRAREEERQFFASASLAERLWDDMRNTEKHDIPIHHDGYLKIYAGDGKRLNYDAILFDEAQDANPATLQILSWQDRSRRIAVGDAYQAIYGFRGAVNALDMLDGTHHSLTESFRFGPNVAACANSVLALLGETRKLKGRGAPTEILPGARFEAATRGEQRTVLTRSNANAVEAAIEFRGSVYFAGQKGSEDYRIDRILDGWRLADERRDEIVDKEIKQFRSFKEMSDYADKVDDVELIGVASAVTKYKGDTPDMVKDVKGREVRDPKDAGLIVSTAHKAKGLEWNNVALGSFFEFQDFVDENQNALENGGEISDEWKAELNLLYVAATRARLRLNPSPELIGAVKMARDAVKAKNEKDVDRPGADVNSDEKAREFQP